MHPDDIDRAMKELKDCIEGRFPDYNVELRLRCKNGSYKWILCRGAIVKRDRRGDALRMTGIHTDISKAKAIEEELIRARESAERANQVKSDFLSSMSHELRTPLNAVLGFGQILEIDKNLSDTQQDYVKEILNGGRQLLELITEVLDLSSMEKGKMVPFT
jgi:signal transduction histidine kinase